MLFVSDDKEDDLLFSFLFVFGFCVCAPFASFLLSLSLSQKEGMRGAEGEGWVSLLGNDDEVRNTVLFVGELEMQFT